MRRVLHLVRGAARPPAVADTDWIVYLDDMRRVQPGPPASIDHDELVRLLFAADLVVTW